MSENRFAKERGQSLVLVAAAMVALVMFVAIAVDVSNAYYHRRTAQNAADGAALAGVSRLATGINKKNAMLDGAIKADMNDFAERNGIEDTNGTLADRYNNNVEGWYVDTSGNRLPGVLEVGLQPSPGKVPAGAYGIEAIAHITAPGFFAGIFGVDGFPLQARAVSLLKQACTADCVVPIVTQKDTLFDENGPMTGSCFNIWSESELGEPGSYGWVSWSWQETVCQDGSRTCPLVEQGAGCDTDNLGNNLHPENCASGYIQVDDWVSNTPGIMNANNQVLCYLDYYLGIWRDPKDCGVSSDVPQPFTIVVYDGTNADNNTGTCNVMNDPTQPSTGGLHYRVAGFAKMGILGYLLSQGGKNVTAQIDNPEFYGLPSDFDPLTDCVTLGAEPHSGNRITALFLEWVEDFNSSDACYDPTGTLLSAPRLTE